MSHFHNVSHHISLTIEMHGNLLHLDVPFSYYVLIASLKWSAQSSNQFVHHLGSPFSEARVGNLVPLYSQDGRQEAADSRLLDQSRLVLGACVNLQGKRERL
jgi:hypothetical protein